MKKCKESITSKEDIENSKQRLKMLELQVGKASLDQVEQLESIIFYIILYNNYL